VDAEPLVHIGVSTSDGFGCACGTQRPAVTVALDHISLFSMDLLCPACVQALDTTYLTPHSSVLETRQFSRTVRSSSTNG
jgi:hypothetical protein